MARKLKRQETQKGIEERIERKRLETREIAFAVRRNRRCWEGKEWFTALGGGRKEKVQTE